MLNFGELISKLHDYTKKIVKDDVNFLLNERRRLDPIQWVIFFTNYKDNFIKENILLFELLINDYDKNCYFTKDEIRKLSQIQTIKTLDYILYKIKPFL